MRDIVRLLIQAAREVQSEELRNALLTAAEEEVRAVARRPRKRVLENAEKLKFPLTISLVSPERGKVTATLNADASVVLDGEEYPTPSSDPLMKSLGFERGNAWPRWRFELDGQTYPIQVLRDNDLIQTRKR